MKTIVLVDASPRQGGNSEIVVDTLAEALAGCEVTVFKMREKDCRFCRACAACQGKETQMCVQRDDITALLPVIDQCDAIVMATPIYNQQITAQAKLFIERWYPFFNREKKNWSNTSRQGKKAALVCSFWGSPNSQIGAEETRTLIFDHIPGRGEIRSRPDYMAQLRELARWLAE